MSLHSGSLAPVKNGRQIIVVGSSIASGQAATTYANSWAGKLTTALPNWTVINGGVPSRASSQLVIDFPSYLAMRPSVIIIQTTLYNDGLYGTAVAATKRSIVDAWKANIALCVLLCRQNNIAPVVVSPPPNGFNTATDYALMQEIQQWIETLGCHAIDFLAACDDGTGKWVAGFNVDENHPNDAGHTALFNTVPLSMFERAFDPPLTDNQPERGEFTFPGGGVLIPLTYTPTSSLNSYTVGFFASTAAASSSLWGVNETSAFTRLRTANASAQAMFAVTANTGVEVDSQVAVAAGYHHHCIRYDHNRGKLAYFIDGVLKGTEATYTQSQAATMMSFMSRADGGGAPLCYMKGITVHRAALLAGSIQQMAKGKVQRASLDGHFPLGTPVTTLEARIQNLAPTASTLLVSASGVALTPASGLTIIS